MELLIILKNSEKDKDKIQEALKKFNCSLFIEDEKIVIKTSSFVGDLNIKDNDAISKVWENVKDFIDVINGSTIVEGFSMSTINLHYVKYIDENGDAKLLPKKLYKN